MQTYNSRTYDTDEPTHGGYSRSIVVDENYVLGIPEGVALDVAAPLLCAGVTLYSPLRHWGAGPGKKVAIVGLGGLGHVGVKIAHAMGAEVTVLSQSLAKKDDGLGLGADHYHATSDPTTFEELAGTFDLIVNTVSATIDVDAYLSLLALDGALVNVGAPPEASEYRAFSLIMGRRSLAGSKIGGIRETQEMLDFCAEPFDVGTFQRGRNGLAPRRTGALRAFAGAIASYCRGDDTVCQRGASGNGHLRYSGDRQSAVDFVAGELGGGTRT